VLLYNSVYAQKGNWTLGIYSGMQIQMLTSIERNYTLSVGDMCVDSWNTDDRRINRVYSPPVELTVRYNITDNFSVSSGIGYANYITQWKPFGTQHVLDSPFALNTYLRKVSILIPLNFRYDIPLKNTGFSIFPKLGLYIDIPIASYTHIYVTDFDTLLSPVFYPDATPQKPIFETSYYSRRKLNVLVNAGIGIAYQFKSGVGISLSGEYSLGIRHPEYINYRLQLKDFDSDIVNYDYDYRVRNRNESWNVLLGVTYTFKKKEKKE
jgi:hypothetical protein